MHPKKKLVRSTQAQLRVMVDYMDKHRNFAIGDYKGPMGNRQHLQEWEDLRVVLKQHGPDKAVGQWRHTWRDLKRRARDEGARLQVARSEDLFPVPKLSYMGAKVLNLLGEGCGLDAADLSEGGSGLDPNASKPNLKYNKRNIFASVRQACIDLVKMHSQSVSLIDEKAFRTLIQLMPMTLKEKARITSEYIQKCIDSNGEEDDAETSCQEERDASDNEDETSDQMVTIKGEIEEVQCNCNPRVTEDSTRCHEVGCPAAAKQPYWNYFEVTTDEATCQICGLNLNWTNITKLKEHLVAEHPNAEFVDDGEEFLRGPGSDVWSCENTEEVYLEEDFDGDPLPTPSASKRKRTSEHLNAEDEGTPREDDKSREERVKAEWTKAIKEDQQDLSEASRRVIVLAPDRFKSLEIFGQYVAELMKLIPKEKCLKYQVQIVRRLLQEQAAAG